MKVKIEVEMSITLQVFPNPFTDNVYHCVFYSAPWGQSLDPWLLDYVSTRQLGANMKGDYI